MKKITLISACMLLFTSVSAEQMQFVTTMSAPVGNFAHLDAADSTHVTSAPILNFCNTRSNVGNIVIKGANAYLKQINIQNGTTLGTTNTPEYRLSEKLTIENGGTVNAGRIMANNVTFKDTNYHKSNVSNTIYGNDIAVMGGKTDNMEISGTAKINKSAQNSANLGEELWWDNQYASDYDSSGNKKSNGKTYTSFLLKSKTASSSSCEPPAGEPTEQFCPAPSTAKQTRTWNYTTCKWNAWQGNCSLKKCLTKATSCFQGTKTVVGSCSGICNIHKGSTLLFKMSPSVVEEELVAVAGYLSKPRDCRPGTECDDCIVGKTYYNDQEIYGETCFMGKGNLAGNCKAYFSFPLYQCSELPNCSQGRPADCRTWGSKVTGFEIWQDGAEGRL